MVASDGIPKILKRLSDSQISTTVSRVDDVMQGGHVVACHPTVAREETCPVLYENKTAASKTREQLSPTNIK